MIKDIQQWAEFTFHASELGDSRRTNRLIKMVCGLAKNVGKSVVQSSKDDAVVEGNYRLIRSKHITAEPIAESGFAATATQAQNYGEILALEDTTSLTYNRENLPDKLGYTSNSLNAKYTGFEAHSILLFSPTHHRVNRTAPMDV
ncbi:transposase DNA-binding-containing protein [Glaciecola siphonariae]|uniref:Transposase DNA-binding-containing protein n=1 Tax=Glaciecola siphonariae TaxID=521012 RepID=A0ABV9LVX3_9ALTE